MMTLETVTSFRLAYLPLAEMEKLASDDPQVARYFARITITNFTMATLALNDLLLGDPTRRVAAVLWRRSAGRGESQLPSKQLMIGRLANASRGQTLAALRKLNNEGAIRQLYGAIEVTQGDLLRHFADSHSRSSREPSKQLRRSEQSGARY